MCQVWMWCPSERSTRYQHICCMASLCLLGHMHDVRADAQTDLTTLTLSPRKAGLNRVCLQLRIPVKAKIPACRFLIYFHKAEISPWKFKKKLLKIMLCLGAQGLGTPCCGSSGVRGLIYRSPVLTMTNRNWSWNVKNYDIWCGSVENWTDILCCRWHCTLHFQTNWVMPV